MALLVLEDFIRPFRPNLEESKAVRITKCVAFATGCICFIAVFLVANVESILDVRVLRYLTKILHISYKSLICERNVTGNFKLERCLQWSCFGSFHTWNAFSLGQHYCKLKYTLNIYLYYFLASAYYLISTKCIFICVIGSRNGNGSFFCSHDLARNGLSNG